MTQSNLLPAISRLREAYGLWHEAAKNYGSPDEFRTYLNACIQALRNVTFVLQKQKSGIDNFEEWYSQWQAALKADKIMAWCVTARNCIVKQGDLETRSIALAAYVASYLEAPKHEFEVDPFVDTAEIAKKIVSKHLPKYLHQEGYLKVERRWIDKGLPEYELLEVLSYAFSVLTQLVMDVQTRQGPKFSKQKENIEEAFSKSASAIQIDKSVIPYCMSSHADWRTVWVKLPSMQIMQYVVKDRAGELVSKEKILKKYGLASPSETKEQSELLKQALYFLEQAKRMLTVDKHLITAVFLISADKKLTILPLEFEDHDQKYVMWDIVASELERRDANAIIVIGEAWVAEFDPQNPTRRPEDASERKEAIKVNALAKDGENFAITVPFTRKWRKIRFQDEIYHDDKYTANFLDPIRRVWGLSRNRTSRA